MTIIHKIAVLFSATALLAPHDLLAQQTVLQLHSANYDGSFASTFLNEYAKRMEERLPGKIDVQVFMGSTLGAEDDVLQGLTLGSHHASLSASSVMRLNPRAAIFELPYLIENRQQLKTFWQSPAGDMLREGFSRNGMVLAAMWDNGFRAITNSVRPIVKPEDLRGLKIRTPNSRQRVAMFNTFGANATPLAWGEVFSGLDQGVLDGQENPAQMVDTGQLYRVQKYLSISNHVYLPTFLLFGQPWLSAQVPEVRDALMEVAVDMASWTFEWGEKEDVRAIAALQGKLAINDVDFDAFRKASAPLYKTKLFSDSVGADMIAATLAALGRN